MEVVSVGDRPVARFKAEQKLDAASIDSDTVVSTFGSTFGSDSDLSVVFVAGAVIVVRSGW